jgi:hypothetical protein
VQQQLLLPPHRLLKAGRQGLSSPRALWLARNGLACLAAAAQHEALMLLLQ